MDWPHRPVMPDEVLKSLSVHSAGVYVDGTLGAAGHAAAVIEATSPDGRLLGLDRDPDALDTARRRLAESAHRVRLVNAPFDQIGRELAHWGVDAADGILLDLGVSSMQLDQAARGFSFRQDGPLDMRMGHQGPSAADLVADSDEPELKRIIYRLGEESLAGPIAKAVIKAREQEPITTTGQLAEVIYAAMPARELRKRKLHPATKTFMALRMAVNDELGHLERFLDHVASWLRSGGRLVVISYHSLEDRLVKRALRQMANPCECPPEMAVCGCGKKPLMELPHKGALKPSAAEVEDNPRARSARLRVGVRTGEPV